PSVVFQVTRTWKRLEFRQSVVASALHASAAEAGAAASDETSADARAAASATPGPAGEIALSSGAIENASVAWIGWNATPCGLTYVRTAPVCVSVTVMTTLTLVRPPANTQNFPFRALPSTTLMTISTLFDEKNQK